MGRTQRLVLILVAVLVLVGVLAYNHVSASDAPEAVYCEYNGAWFQFRSDWQGQPQDWDSINELRAFLQYDDTEQRNIYIEVMVIGLKPPCWQKAQQLRDNAYYFGKYLETETLSYNEFIMYYHMIPSSKFHTINKAYVYNSELDRTEVWFIEPQNDRHWYVCELGKYI